MNTMFVLYEPTPNGDVLIDLVAPKDGSYIVLDTDIYVRDWDGNQPKPYMVAKVIHTAYSLLEQWTGKTWCWREYVLPTAKFLKEQQSQC